MGPGETNEQLGKGEGATRRLDPPTMTIASGDETTMNVPGEANFLAPPTRCELRRTTLPRTQVNKGKRRRGRESSGPRPTNCLTSGLPPRLGDGADPPHQAEVLGDAPGLGDLPSLYATYRDASKVHPIAGRRDVDVLPLVGCLGPPVGYDLVPSAMRTSMVLSKPGSRAGNLPPPA